MSEIIIRNVTSDQLAGLDALARQAGQSRQKYLLERITEMVGGLDPEIILGYIGPLQGGDDLGDTECDCGALFEEAGVYIGYTGDLRIIGPKCGFCATD